MIEDETKRGEVEWREGREGSTASFKKVEKINDGV